MFQFHNAQMLDLSFLSKQQIDAHNIITIITNPPKCQQVPKSRVTVAKNTSSQNHHQSKHRHKSVDDPHASSHVKRSNIHKSDDDVDNDDRVLQL